MITPCHANLMCFFDKSFITNHAVLVAWNDRTKPLVKKVLV